MSAVGMLPSMTCLLMCLKAFVLDLPAWVNSFPDLRYFVIDVRSTFPSNEHLIEVEDLGSNELVDLKQIV